jgi:hypothetical protein
MESPLPVAVAQTTPVYMDATRLSKPTETAAADEQRDSRARGDLDGDCYREWS